jgi:hypothetical protein
MKPYTLSLAIEEAMTINYALEKGLFYTKLFAKTGSEGDRCSAKQIEEALTLMDNRPVEGGVESQQELNAAATADMAEQCTKYGYD